MKNLFLTCLFITISTTINAQTIFGKWLSKNEDTGKVDSVIEVYENKGKAYAKIVKVMDPSRQNAVCNLCEGEKKNQKILGMNILDGLKKDGDEWSGGTIVDPRNGKVYQCYIELEEANKLKIRGYIGFALLGKTKYWTREE